MSDFLNDLSFLVVLIVLIVAGVGAASVALVYSISRPSCYAHWRDSGLQARWSLYGDCQVSADGRTWVTDDAWIAMHKRVHVEQK